MVILPSPHDGHERVIPNACTVARIGRLNRRPWSIGGARRGPREALAGAVWSGGAVGRARRRRREAIAVWAVGVGGGCGLRCAVSRWPRRGGDGTIPTTFGGRGGRCGGRLCGRRHGLPGGRRCDIEQASGEHYDERGDNQSGAHGGLPSHGAIHCDHCSTFPGGWIGQAADMSLTYVSRRR